MYKPCCQSWAAYSHQHTLDQLNRTEWHQTAGAILAYSAMRRCEKWDSRKACNLLFKITHKKAWYVALIQTKAFTCGCKKCRFSILVANFNNPFLCRIGTTNQFEGFNLANLEGLRLASVIKSTITESGQDNMIYHHILTCRDLEYRTWPWMRNAYDI